MKQKKIIIASLCALILVFLQGNGIIACENEEYTGEDEKNDDSSYVPTYFQYGTFLDNLIERYPILDSIIQMILELIQNFLIKINLTY